MFLLIALLLIIATYATKITSKLGISVLLLFLGIGMLIGSDTLNFIYFDDAVLTQKIANIELITTQKSDIDVFEIQIPEISSIDGTRLRELNLPPDSLITSIMRENYIIIPKEDTILKKHDILFAIAPYKEIDLIRSELSK